MGFNSGFKGLIFTLVYATFTPHLTFLYLIFFGMHLG